MLLVPRAWFQMRPPSLPPPASRCPNTQGVPVTARQFMKAVEHLLDPSLERQALAFARKTEAVAVEARSRARGMAAAAYFMARRTTVSALGRSNGHRTLGKSAATSDVACRWPIPGDAAAPKSRLLRETTDALHLAQLRGAFLRWRSNAKQKRKIATAAKSRPFKSDLHELM